MHTQNALKGFVFICKVAGTLTGDEECFNNLITETE